MPSIGLSHACHQACIFRVKGYVIYFSTEKNLRFCQNYSTLDSDLFRVYLVFGVHYNDVKIWIWRKIEGARFCKCYNIPLRVN